MKHIFYFALISLFFLPNTTFAQAEIYMDENFKEISIEKYNKKCYSEIFKCSTYKTDSLKINKVLFRYAFGKIPTSDYDQLRQLLMKQANLTITKDRTIILNYRDTLQDYASRLKHRNKHIKAFKDKNQKRKDSGFKTIKYQIGKLTYKKYIREIKTYEKKIKKCIVLAETKYNSNTFFFYNYDKGYLKDTKNIKWIEDNGVIKNTFFKIMYQSHLVIIKPDGNYFLSGSYLSDERLAKILNNDWSRYKQDWNNSITTNSKTGIGFFEKEKTGHKSHCF